MIDINALENELDDINREIPVIEEEWMICSIKIGELKGRLAELARRKAEIGCILVGDDK